MLERAGESEAGSGDKERPQTGTWASSSIEVKRKGKICKGQKAEREGLTLNAQLN